MIFVDIFFINKVILLIKLFNNKKISTKNISRHSEIKFLSIWRQMSHFQPAISTSSLYFGAGGAVLNLSSSNSLRILMSTHGLHAAILGKNAFQFGILGPSHLAQLPLSCACALEWKLTLYTMKILLFPCAAILKAIKKSQECPK